MGFNDISRSFGHGVGKLVGTTRKVLSWPGSALSKVIEKLRSVFPSARTRAIVTEELMRLMGAEGLAEEKLEQRFKVMAETILALQEKLDEMVACGHISETDMLEAMNVFRQNLVIQKPELVNAAVDESFS